MDSSTSRSIGHIWNTIWSPGLAKAGWENTQQLRGLSNLKSIRGRIKHLSERKQRLKL